MLYSAMCIDNSMYATTGYIRVRVFAYFHWPRTNLKEINDLSHPPEGVSDLAALGGTLEHNEDFKAMVYAPFGGGRNFGAFKLPQVNEKGIVAFLDGDVHKPLWLGSYFTPIRDDTYVLQTVNAPGDDLEADGADKDFFAGGAQVATEDPTDTMVVRTKHTKLDSDLTKMDFEEQDTENVIIMNKNKVVIRHYSTWEGHEAKNYQEILIDDATKSITATVRNVTDDKTTYVKLQEDKVILNAFDSQGSPETTTNVEITAAGVKFINSGDFLVTYNDLRTIINKIETHKHTRFPAGGTDGTTGHPYQFEML